MNFFDLMTLPHRFLLTLIGLGENNFKNKFIRCLYYLYFLAVIGLFLTSLIWKLISGLCDYGAMNCDNTAFQAMHCYNATKRNTVDLIASSGREVVFYYREVVTFIFILWTVPWNRFNPLSRFLSDEKNLAFVNEVLKKKRGAKLTKECRYLIGSYFILVIYLVNVISVDLSFYLSDDQCAIDIFGVFMSRFLPNIIITLILAKACAVYLCNTAVWDCFNESLENQNSNQSSDDDINDSWKKYDSVSDFTEIVSDLFRYYNTVHIATVTALIATVYESIYVKDMTALPKAMCWIFEIMHLSAFCVAALVHASSSGTPRSIYKAYKKWEIESDISKTDDSKFNYFLQYVAHEWAPTSLDVAGVLSITFATVGVLVFTAINWIGVVIQFRQGTPDDDNSNSTLTSSLNSLQYSCSDVMAFLKMANFTHRP